MISVSFETFVNPGRALGRTTLFVMGAPITGGFWATSGAGLGWCAEGVPTEVEDDGSIRLCTLSR